MNIIADLIKSMNAGSTALTTSSANGDLASIFKSLSAGSSALGTVSAG